MLIIKTLLVATLVCFSLAIQANDRATVIDCDQSKHCTFVLLDGKTGKITLKNVPRALKRFSPFSTFKIANTAYGLETGVLKSVDQTLHWDNNKYPPQDWWPKPWSKPKHTLKSAFEVSALPWFQTIIHQYQPEKLKAALKEYRYGNGDISSGIDNFWLNGSLQISAVEQVKSMRRLFENRKVLSQKSSDILKQVMRSDVLGELTNTNLVVYAKTGADLEHKNFGWLVGAIDNQGHWYYFATNVDGKDFNQVRQQRLAVTQHYLEQLGVLDKVHNTANKPN